MLVIFASCNVSKQTTENVVGKAKRAQKVDSETYVTNKLNVCKWLNFSDKQNADMKILFTDEITALKKIDSFDDREIAKHIYRYESRFREGLDAEQLKVYKKLRPKFDEFYFYSKWEMNRIESSTLKIT